MTLPKPIVLLTIIIAVYLVNSIVYLNAQSVNADEGSFSNYAVRYLKGQPARTMPRTDNSKMPVIALNMIPRVIQQIINPGLEKNDEGVTDIMMGRYVSLLFSIFTILILYRWGTELYGSQTGIIAALLYSFCPNTLANASFVSTDGYSELMLVATLYLFWRWIRKGSLQYFVWFSLLVAFSQLVKQSLFHLYVLIPLLLICTRLFYKNSLIHIRRPVVLVIIFLLINFFVINLGYYFYQSFRPLGDYHFMSGLFIEVQRLLPKSFPMPFPSPFVEGLDMAKYYDQVGGGITGVSSFGKVTILGQEATGGAFWYYYLVTLFFKTPIGILILFCAGLSLRPRMNWDKFVLLFPLVYFLIVFSFFYKTQAGIRHIVFLYPFIFLVAASVFSYVISSWQKKLFIACCVYTVISTSIYWSNYYPYTNEFILDKKNAWQIVGAANLEILQGRKLANKYLEKHPEVKFATRQAGNGIFLVTTEQYLDTWNTGDYQWLRRDAPFAHLGYSWMLIEVGGKK